MINYFYNIKLKDEKVDFYSDVLTTIRKDYYLSKQKQKGKITQNSDADYINFEFSLEKDKMLKWSVSDNRSIISESRQKEDGKYSVNYYEDNGGSKVLTFSKFHTLLRVDYYDTKISTSPYCTVEPRKNNDDLCLLLSKKSTYASTVLYAMPQIDDEYMLDKVEEEFSDYTAVASTNAGVVKFLSDDQLVLFEAFVEKAKKQKEIDLTPESFIAQEDAQLANILNPKDFNIKKNLAEAIDITMADEFAHDIDDVIVEVVGDNYAETPQELDFIDFVQECCSGSNAKETSANETQTQNNTQTPDVVSQEVAIDLCEEIEDVPVDTVEAAEEQLDEPETQDVVEVIAPQVAVSSLQAEIDAMFEDEVEASDADDMLDMLSKPAFIPHEEPVVPEQEVIDFTDLAEIKEEPTTTKESEIIEEPKALCEEQPEDTFEEPQDNVLEDLKPSDEPLEDFNVEQQEIPDCIIESSSTRYLYFGDIDEQGKRTGFGRTATDNGRTAYEGGYVDNKRDGLGAYYYKDGELCYYGEWKNNKRDGFGIGISSVDKSAHIGNFVDNKPDGFGVRVDRDGEVRFIKRPLSDGNYVIVRFDNDRIIITKYSENGDIISENSSNMMYF